MIQPNPSNTGDQSGMSCPPGSTRMDTLSTSSAPTEFPAASAQGTRSAGEVAGQAAADMRETARSATEQVKQQGREAVHRFREQAAQTTEQWKEQGRSMAAEQKDHLAENIHGVGEAIRDAANRLHDEEDHNLARYTEALADQVERVSGYLRSHDLRGLMSDCENLARRRPELLLGGMFVTGLAIGRFLKASRRRRDRDFDRADFGSEYDYGFEGYEEYEARPVGVAAMQYGDPALRGDTSIEGTWGDEGSPSAPITSGGFAGTSPTAPATSLTSPDIEATSDLPSSTSSEGSACDLPNKPR